ncbi:MAG: O-antigen ligase family protein [Bacteroidaceae bacterium]|nr:O-antigen ligase family protein [Bacteroidaceae bacterium]
MERLTRYWLLLFLLCNICAQYRILEGFTYFLFYPLLAFAVMAILTNIQSLFTTQMLSRYRFLYIYIIICWLYQLAFGLMMTHEETWMYLAGKTAMLFMTVLAVEQAPDYYYDRFPRHYLVFCVVLLVLGLTVMDRVGVDGRHYFGFGNPNSGGHLAAICASGLFITNPFENKWLSRGMMAVCLLTVLMSGSRASLGVALVGLFMKYGFNVRAVIPAAIVYFVFFVMPSMGYRFTGVERFITSVETGDYSSGRDQERQATLLMIREAPFVGNGICTPMSSSAKEISKMGSHNTYLDWLKWFGIPFGAWMIFELLACTYRQYLYYRKSDDDNERYHLFVVVSTVVTCYFEGYIWGLNEMSNTIFFASLAILMARRDYEEEDEDDDVLDAEAEELA